MESTYFLEYRYAALRGLVNTPQITLPSPWAEFLEEVDARLTASVELHCLGGFVLTVFHSVPRRTGDIDSLAVLPLDQLGTLMEVAGRDSALARKHGIHIHYVAGAEAPEDYQERLIPIVPDRFRYLRLFALDVHDLILAKLTRNYPVDIEDVKYLAQEKLLNPDILRERYLHELRPRLSNEKRHDLTLELWLSYFEEPA